MYMADVTVKERLRKKKNPIMMGFFFFLLFHRKAFRISYEIKRNYVSKSSLREMENNNTHSTLARRIRDYAYFYYNLAGTGLLKAKKQILIVNN